MVGNQSRGCWLRPETVCDLVVAVNAGSSDALAEKMLSALEAVVPQPGGGLHEPLFRGNEKRYLEECVDSGYVSSVGEFVGRFETELANFVGAPHALAVVNGTSGLHLALVGLGVGPGDEVIVPALSFVATASAVALVGAVPHFVDVSYDSWGVGADELRNYLESLLELKAGKATNKITGRPVTAIVFMHTLGFPADARGLVGVARNFGLVCVEDAAESLGSWADESHTGLAGDAGVFSFNGNKTVTTGGGGAVVTRDPGLAHRLRHLSTTAKVPHRYEFDHDELGFNYRMPNINAALGLAQLEQLPLLIAKQRQLHEMYVEALNDLSLGVMKSESDGATSNYWLQAFVLDPNFAARRNVFLDKFLDAGMPVRPMWRPLNGLAPYQHSPSAPTPVTEDLYSRVLCLPSSARLAA